MKTFSTLIIFRKYEVLVLLIEKKKTTGSRFYVINFKNKQGSASCILEKPLFFFFLNIYFFYCFNSKDI